jgi:hypothetical protein
MPEHRTRAVRSPHSAQQVSHAGVRENSDLDVREPIADLELGMTTHVRYLDA